MSRVKETQYSVDLPISVQKNLNWFAFFLGYPCFYLLGNSITLYIFIYILLLLNSKCKRLFNLNSISKKILLLFSFFTFLGLVFSPWSDLREISLRPFLQYFQFFYWVTISLFLIEFYLEINWDQVFKFFFIGLFIQIVAFYTVKRLSIDLGFITLLVANNKSRNSLLFQMIGAVPFLLAYLQWKKVNIYFSITVVFFILSSTILSGGRAGTVIVFLVCIIFYLRRFVLRPIVFLSFIMAFFAMYLNFNLIEGKLEGASYYIEPFNERLAQMLRGKGENTDLSQDRSLLERQLHIEKGYEIIQKYPFLGLGISNYVNYDSPIEDLFDSRFLRLQGESVDYYNRRSPHNSYVQVASEMGFIGLTCFLVIILYPLGILFFKNHGNIWSIAALLSLLGISLHFYTIASAYGTITWFFIGIANAEAYRITLKKNL